jgi:hypothetical protein
LPIHHAAVASRHEGEWRILHRAPRRAGRRRHAASGSLLRETMTAFNVVRFRVKPGRDQEFLDAHRSVDANWPGLKKVNIIKTGDQTYCIIAEWADITDLAAARPNMIATLNSFRDTLEDLGGELGVTDPVSGPVVLALK